MKLQLSLEKDPLEIEKSLATSYFDCVEVYETSSGVEKGGTVYIIPEDQPHYVLPSLWAMGDSDLEELFERGTRMKCVILADKILVDGKPLTQGEKLIGIKGYCLDDGGDNYIALPETLSKETNTEIQLCNCEDVQDFLLGK